MRVVLAVVAVLAARAEAGPAEWELSEVERAGPGNDADVRFVELYAAEAGCWFPSTQVTVHDSGGAVLDTVAPFASTTCFAADTYVLLATSGAEALHGVTATSAQVPAFAAGARQLCLRSTGTIYDCVRWGNQSVVIHDLFAPDDDSSATAPPAGAALARIASTHVVADDWIVAEPTPGGPNDGAPIDVPDAGPDAGPSFDAAVAPDAGPSPDARVVDAGPDPDARSNLFLDLDATGGAGCGCQGGGGDAGGGDAGGLVVVLSAVMACRRSSAARRSRGRGPRRASSSSSRSRSP